MQSLSARLKGPVDLQSVPIDKYDFIVYTALEVRTLTRKFVYTASFRACWKAMGLRDADLPRLEEALLEDPKLGDVIQGTGGARKMRISLDGQGKRGGGRVIYLDVFEKESLYLLFAYPKNVQADLTPDQKKAIRAIVEQIKKE